MIRLTVFSLARSRFFQTCLVSSVCGVVLGEFALISRLFFVQDCSTKPARCNCTSSQLCATLSAPTTRITMLTTQMLSTLTIPTMAEIMTTTTTSTATTSTTSSMDSDSVAPNSVSSSIDGAFVGAIVGGALGAVAFVGVLIAVIAVVVRRRRELPDASQPIPPVNKQYSSLDLVSHVPASSNVTNGYEVGPLDPTA